MAGLLWYRSYMDSLANTSGYYPDIHAGHADRVTELTLEEPYLVRETPAGYNQLELAQIIGGTMVVEGSLQSVEATAHVTVGKNLMNFVENEMVTRGYDCYFPNPIPSAGTYKLTCQNRFGGASNYGVAVVFKNEVGGENVGGFYAGYSFGDTSMEGTTTTITAEQAAAPYITFMARSIGMTFESLKNAFIQIELGSIATAYEPYTETNTPLANITLRGISTTVDGVLSYDGDTYDPDGTVTRYFGERAYQAGDENLPDAVTDGTNTVYKLTTPVTESAAPYTATQTVEAGGMVQFVTSNNIPVGNVSIYRRV